MDKFRNRFFKRWQLRHGQPEPVGQPEREPEQKSVEELLPLHIQFLSSAEHSVF